MDENPTETLETQHSPSVSLDSDRTVGDSSPNSPSPDQTLDDPSNSTSVPAELSIVDFKNELSPSCDGSPDRQASTLLQDTEFQEEEDGGGDSPPLSSPVDTFWRYTHWAQPWSTIGFIKPDLQSPAAPPPELCPLVVDTITDDLPWDDCSGRDENDSKRPAVVPGLPNLGNTCFLNAILQCFTHTVPIIQGLLSCNHEPCDRYLDWFCVLCAFRDHIDASLSSPRGIISPLRFVDNLNYFSSEFRRYQQEDAHEFLQCFLDRLESCCNNSSEMKDSSSSSSQDENNIVKQCFGGRLVSRLQCCNCDHYWNTYEPSICLSLELEDVNSLQSALESFTKVEKLEDTKFTCENCKEQVLLEKQLMLEEAPSVAALHLKRFKSDGAFIEKIDRDIDFPLELDLEPYTNSSGGQTNHEELKYDLYAVVVHIGYSSTSGHYYCFIRYAPGTWYKFDDSEVSRVHEEHVLAQEAYILFYAKQGTPWFSNIIEARNPNNLEPEISNTSPKSVLDNVDGVSTSSSNLPESSNSNNHSNNSDASNETFSDTFNGSRNDPFKKIGEQEEAEGSDDGYQRVYGPLPLQESNSYDKFPWDDKDNNTDCTVLSPPRSPSPDGQEKDHSPEMGFYNTRNRVRSVDQVNPKRQANKKNILEEDPGRKEACKLLKTLHPTRRSQLAAAMDGTHSDGALNVNKKKKHKKSGRSILNPRRSESSPSSSENSPKKLSLIPRGFSVSSFR